MYLHENLHTYLYFLISPHWSTWGILVNIQARLTSFLLVSTSDSIGQSGPMVAFLAPLYSA